MPGLKQLKKFSTDVKNLGDEVSIRAKRGEKPADVPLPEGISEDDDSEDFVAGIPSESQDQLSQEGTEGAVEDTTSDSQQEQEKNVPVSPDLDSILNPESIADDELPDLSDFLTPPVQDDSEESPSSKESSSIDEFAYDGSPIDMNEGSPEEFFDQDSAPLTQNKEAESNNTEIPLSSESDESVPKTTEAAPEEILPVEPVSDSQSEPVAESAAGEVDQKDFDLSTFDTSMLDTLTDTNVIDQTKKDDQQNIPEIFDTSEMDGVDFSQPVSTDPGIEFPVTDPSKIAGNTDFQFDTGAGAFDGDFEIPGFSDTPTAEFDKKGASLGIPDFSKEGTVSSRAKNTLTEQEYKQFKKNILEYPLNLRVAIEDLIVKNEFTDDAVFEIIRKVIAKDPARQIAAQLEKMLDISISVPRNYERRSVAQYQAYKSSFQYQLRNRIIPGAIAAVIVALLGYSVFVFGDFFIYRPLKAQSLYRQGYTLLENNAYPQSEQKFTEAVTYRPVRKWFLRYADGYRTHKQYERAEKMYNNTLSYFNYDKQAGLEYASMELNDLANYSKAEEITRRDVLDHHINDRDGLLLLGDIFLEWADTDASKYDDAREQYATLIQLYGQTNLYMSRMMRYFIRTDKLHDVLELKNRFYPQKKSLSGADWIELSGYLLDKLYGKLSPSEEYLRSSIEDVREMLERGISASPSDPVGHYNLGRYFVNTANPAAAKSELERSINLFDAATVSTRRNTYREINATRLLGEQYASEREYLKAQSIYTKGLDLFVDANSNFNLPGDANTGKLYADMGDINYFISGDFDTARQMYESSINTNNDTPSIRYRVGAIYYNKNDYAHALGSFIKAAESKPDDPNLLLALGNVLSLRGDNFAAQGYYEGLLKRLDLEKSRHSLLQPAKRAEDYDLLDMYVKSANNLGVTLYRLAHQTGNSELNAEAVVRLSDSIRAWDALTRDPDTMVRMAGSNLAAQNSKYMTHPVSDYEPAIYTEIPQTLVGEKELEK